MELIILLIVVFVVMLAVFGFIIYKAIQKTDPRNLEKTSNTNNVNTSNEKINESIGNAKEFVLAKDFGDFFVDLGNFQYRAYIEQEIVEIGFQRFLNSLTYPISIYILTRKVDLSKIVKRMKKSSDKMVKQFPVAKTYADLYIERMSTLAVDIGHTLQKKKYVCIPYGDSFNMQNLTEEEKKEYSYSELLHRTKICAENLASIGLSVKILDKKEIFEMLYAVFHRNNYQLAKAIVNGKMSELFVCGDFRKTTKSYDKIVISMLNECTNRIKLSDKESEYEELFYRDVEYVLNNLQNILVQHTQLNKDNKEVKELKNKVNLLKENIRIVKSEIVSDSELEDFDFEENNEVDKDIFNFDDDTEEDIFVNG